jgi:hypothetical protein
MMFFKITAMRKKNNPKIINLKKTKDNFLHAKIWMTRFKKTSFLKRIKRVELVQGNSQWKFLK